MKVTIAGAGIIGYAIAYELASRGVTVQIVDMRGAGGGATRASAGMLAPHIEGHNDDMLRLGLCSLSLYDGFVERVSADGRQPVEYQRSGTLQVACSADEAEELDRAADRLASGGVAHTLVDGAGARALEPALAREVVGALLIPEHGSVGVASLMSALGAAALRLGVSFSTGRVDAINETTGGVCVDTSGGAIESDAVIVATGSWTALLPLLGASAPIVRPIRGQLVHLRFPQPPLSRVTWGTGCYLVPWRDGSLLIGATVEDVGFDESATVAGVRTLLEAGADLLPAVRGAVFHEVRTGLRPATPDQLPLIGSSSTMRGVFYATGHYRNGVLLAPLTAKVMADLVIDRREARELALVRPVRFGL